jgi:hypothetical protein
VRTAPIHADGETAMDKAKLRGALRDSEYAPNSRYVMKAFKFFAIVQTERVLCAIVRWVATILGGYKMSYPKRPE